MREPLRMLEVMGLVRTGAGSGPTSGAVIVATPRGAISALLRLQVAAQGFPLAAVVANRLLLERATAVALAERAYDFRDANAILAAMDEIDLTPREFLAVDAPFHLALAVASGNVVVAATRMTAQRRISDAPGAHA